MEQLAARRAHNPKVAGSSPAPATKEFQKKGQSNDRPFSLFGAWLLAAELFSELIQLFHTALLGLGFGLGGLARFRLFLEAFAQCS